MVHTARTLPVLRGPQISCCSEELGANPAQALRFITGPDSTFQSLQHLAGKFMRTGLFSGVLALSLHVLIGTREAVSANVFVP